jgi:hypothetical protein
MRRLFIWISLLFNCIISSSAFAQDTSIASQLKSQLVNKCWTCEIYSNLVDGLNSLFTSMFKYLTEESPSFIAFVFIIFALVLVWRILKIISLPLSDHELRYEWDSLFRYIGRIAVVVLFFFSTEAIGMVGVQSWNGSSLNPIRDFFMDGPLVVGTTLACTIGEKAQEGAQDAGLTVSAFSCSDGGGSWLEMHKDSAVAILKAFHEMGANGISLGIGTATMAGNAMTAGNVSAGVTGAVAGFALAMLYIGFTISFGLRYIDALLRAMASLALLPIFLFLWVFDTTRSISHAAYRSVLFMAGLFACSGLTFVMALSIMEAGCKIGTGNSCSDLSSTSLMNITGFGAVTSAEFNYVAYLFLVGCCGISIGIAGATFRIAEELTSFGGAGNTGEIGIGQQVGGDMSRTVSGSAGSVISRTFGFFGK